MNELEIIESPKGEKEPYKTSNLHIAAVLKTVGHKFLEIRRQLGENGEETNRVEFLFDHNDVKGDLTKWMNNDLRVCPRTLLSNEEHLKSLVHSKGWKEQAKQKPGVDGPKKKRRRRRRKKKTEEESSGEQPAPQEPTVDGPEASEPGGQPREEPK